MSYAELVDNIQKLSYEDKLRLEGLLRKYLIEEKREQIYKDYLETANEVRDGKSITSSSTDELMKFLEE